MSVWLLAFPVLISAVLASAASSRVLKVDALLMALADMGLGSMEQAFCAGKDFAKMVDGILEELYSTEYRGKRVLSYTNVLHEFNMVVQDAGRDAGVAEAYNALEHTDRFNCIRFIPEAQFG